MVEPQNPDRVKERAAASDGLARYLVRNVPLVALGGGLAGLFMSVGAPLPQMALSAGIFVLLGLMLGLPIMSLKWWAARRDTDLTVQEQLFLGMNNWRSRLLLSMPFPVLVTGVLALDPAMGMSPMGMISMLLATTAIFFVVIWVFALVLRASGLMPEQSQ
ncbi:hypothetical protein [Gymnodinialimonas hymeniacidonis]|uniref:hypothetical protein n=1 Tax=Gymnodinialimonas hymeniacidonis TaxID=3126508 RepID=UPI0034C63564